MMDYLNLIKGHFLGKLMAEAIPLINAIAIRIVEADIFCYHRKKIRSI